ncbi:MTTP isoform 1, partial [Pan troglodytes]
VARAPLRPENTIVRGSANQCQDTYRAEELTGSEEGHSLTGCH